MQPSRTSVSFDRAVEYYDNTRGFAPGHETPATALFVPAGRLQPGCRLLEIGVGTGRIALPLSEQIRAEYVGIDISPAMLARLHGKPGAERVRTLIGDATALAFPDACFDAVIAVHIFHLIPHWPEALAEAARVLKPGGLLLHGWGQRIALGDLERVWNDAIQNTGRLDQWYQDEGGSAFIDGQGWAQHGPQITYDFVEHRSPLDFLDGLRQRRWSHLWRMPEAEIAHGIAAVEAHITAHYPQPDQPQPAPQRFRVQAYTPPARA